METSNSIKPYGGHRSSDLVDDILSLLNFYVNNKKFKSFLDLYQFLLEHRKVIDIVLEYIETDEDREDALQVQNFLRDRLFR